MGAVLIDNWTLHDITYHLEYVYHYEKSELANLENLLMAILLWDQIYFWDNGTTAYWKNESKLMRELPSLTGLVLPPEVEFAVQSLTGTDVVADGAQQYLLIAGENGIDYLPKQERYQYLTSKKYYHTRNAVWQKVITETVEKSVQEYYDELVKMMGNIQLQFRFPLLLDYVGSQMKEIGDYDKFFAPHTHNVRSTAPYYFVSEYITAALHMRETAPLYNLRSWIKDLHLYIDKGNWVEVRHSMSHVEDIVSMIRAPLAKDVTFQVGIPLSASMNIPSNRLKGSHKTQLTFLHDIAKFALEKRPEL